MKVLLVCNQGMSTGILVENMKKFGSEEDYVEAVPVSKISAVAKNFDVILVGPQIRYKFNEIEKVANENNIKASMIDMMAYGMMDGQAVMNQAKKLLGE
ncbi:MAG: PTS sugar transporter subunit IIB [Traorella sp.]